MFQFTLRALLHSRLGRTSRSSYAAARQYQTITMAEGPQPSPPTLVEANQNIPKMSAADFRVYNSMAEHMEYFVSPHSRSRSR